MLKIQLTIAFLFSAFVIFAQNAPSVAFSNKPIEIGFDFVSVLQNDKGAAILLKQRVNKSTPKMWEKQLAIRVLAAFNKNDNVSMFNWGVRGDSAKLSFDTTDYRRVNFSLGIERQVVRKRMRFSFGTDIIYEKKWGHRYSANYLQKPTGTFLTYASSSNNQTRSLGLSIFGGFNYYLFRFMSIGMEVNIPILMEHHISDTNSGNGLNHYDSYILDTGFGIPRLFYVGFHF